jgi:hypothetical protein
MLSRKFVQTPDRLAGQGGHFGVRNESDGAFEFLKGLLVTNEDDRKMVWRSCQSLR